MIRTAASRTSSIEGTMKIDGQPWVRERRRRATIRRYARMRLHWKSHWSVFDLGDKIASYFSMREFGRKLSITWEHAP